MKICDKILKDFSHKCKGGEPDFTNSTHLNYLRESLIKFGWNKNTTNAFLGNLRDGKKVIVEKRKAGETWKTQTGWAGLKAGEEDARYGMDSEETAVAYVSGQEVGGEEDEGGGVARAPAKRRPSRRPTQPTKVEKDESELWEIGASVNRINDNIYGEPITIKKYITEDNDIKVIIGENIYLKSPDIIMENVTVELVSKKIRE